MTENIMAAYQLLLFLNLLSCVLAANFAIFPMFGFSHSLYLSKLGRELIQRGHKVTMFVGSTFHKGKKETMDPDELAFNDTEFLRLSAEPVPRSPGFEEWIVLLKCQSVYCDALLSNKALMKEIEKADLIIGEMIYLCSSLVADKFSLPHVLLSPAPLNTPSAVALGHHLPPSYIPQFDSIQSDRMTFFERIKNTLMWLRLRVSFWFDLCPAFDRIKRKHNITVGKSIQETLGKVDLVISQSDFTLEFARPLLPNTRVVGPFLASPAQPLPEELETFMQSSGEDGVILVSFGTVVGAFQGIDDSALQMMANTFSKLPQKVIWKLKLSDDSKVKLGKNTKRLAWLPQNDILGHPKTRLFIGHAGFNGLLESMYHGVPMICFPFFGDQFENAQIVKHAGAGESQLLSDIRVDEFVGLIRKVLTEPRYRESAGRISKAIKLLPRHPVKEAADWVEYTQAQGGLPHLRPRELDLPFYQLYLLDVLFVALLTFVLSFFMVRFLIKSVVNCLFRPSKKTKTN